MRAKNHSRDLFDMPRLVASSTPEPGVTETLGRLPRRSFLAQTGAAATVSALAMAGCRSNHRQKTIGVAFETLQSEYWVASFDIMRTEIERQGLRMVQAIADGDANRQLEQIKSFVARRVSGIIVAPKDSHTVIPMIKAANRRDIPIVCYNRLPAESQARSITVGSDNFGITKSTVSYMCDLARQQPPPGGQKKHQALLILGDLGDINAIGRRDGFDAAVSENADIIDVVARVPSEWNQEKALAGVTNALQANPDISLLFTSSDFLLPSIVSALRAAGKYHRIGEPGHVIMGAFDGDATAYKMLQDGYLDADGVQDAYQQGRISVASILDHNAGKPVDSLILDRGLVVHQGNLATHGARMWGAALADKSA